MRGLTIMVAGPDRARFRAALGLAATHAALGGRTRLFLDGPAVALMRDDDAGDDARHVAMGLPGLAELIGTATALGATITLCQTGMAQAAITLDAIDTAVTAGGLVTLLADLGDDRLLAL